MSEQPVANGVVVEGLDGLVRAIGRIDKGLYKQVQVRLREVGRIVAEEAKGIAEYEGLRGDEDYDKHQGALIARIVPSVRGGRVFIRDSAKTVSRAYPGGYNYPAQYEFGKGGYRSFMRKALIGRREDVVHEMEKVVDWVATEWGA